jgi:hypothetical protein
LVGANLQEKAMKEKANPAGKVPINETIEGGAEVLCSLSNGSIDLGITSNEPRAFLALYQREI